MCEYIVILMPMLYRCVHSYCYTKNHSSGNISNGHYAIFHHFISLLKRSCCSWYVLQPFVYFMFKSLSYRNFEDFLHKGITQTDILVYRDISRVSNLNFLLVIFMLPFLVLLYFYYLTIICKMIISFISTNKIYYKSILVDYHFAGYTYEVVCGFFILIHSACP